MSHLSRKRIEPRVSNKQKESELSNTQFIKAVDFPRNSLLEKHASQISGF